MTSWKNTIYIFGFFLSICSICGFESLLSYISIPLLNNYKNPHKGNPFFHCRPHLNRKMMPTHRSVCTLIGFLMLMVIASNGQENTQTRIPNSLAECYANDTIFNRDTRLPSNINLLIEIIRKVEDSPGFNMDMRTLSASLVHRFRMDGIERAPGIFQANVLPFSPSGFQFSKHRVLLTRLIPGSTNNPFPNAVLTIEERVLSDSQGKLYFC